MILYYVHSWVFCLSCVLFLLFKHKTAYVMRISDWSSDVFSSDLVRVAGVVQDPSPPKRIYDPAHPMADAQGYVTMPNVDPVAETVNMIAASRSYQANVEVLNTAKQLMMKTLTIGQS